MIITGEISRFVQHAVYYHAMLHVLCMLEVTIVDAVLT